LAEEWYERIVSALKDTPFETKLKNAPWIQKSSGMIPHAVGLNEHFRLLKYKQGQFFQAHTDESFVRRTSDGMGVGDMSCVSVHAYLSQNFKGGFTTFLSEGRYLDVKPRTGSILLFQHDIMHEGQTVTQGTKYLLRSDVMYSTHSSCTTNDTVSGTAPTEQL
jgi:predicted 2-oxoglutarate/Fe(II)-dependent dioxygenase YbiX